MSAGKGSSPRPFDVPREDYEASFDRIFGKRERVPYVPPPLPVEREQKETRERK